MIAAAEIRDGSEFIADGEGRRKGFWKHLEIMCLSHFWQFIALFVVCAGLEYADFGNLRVADNG